MKGRRVDLLVYGIWICETVITTAHMTPKATNNRYIAALARKLDISLLEGLTTTTKRFL
jgi:hypothetical protein